MPDLKIDYLSPQQIQPRPRAYRKHSNKQIELIGKWLKRHGCVEPLLVDSENHIVCGEAVAEAAKRIGLNRLPVVRAEHMSDSELRAYALAANKLSEMSGYDDELLALELKEIDELLGDVDLSDLGFEPGEIDRLLGFTDGDKPEDEHWVDPDPACPVAKLGDVWQLGRHRLLCGDALNSERYDVLLDGEKAQLVLSDVPYNLPAKQISGNGRFKHEDFVQGAGEMSKAEFTDFLTGAMQLMRKNSIDGSIHMLFMSWHYLSELLQAGHIAYDELKNICTWVKKSGGMGSFYRSQTEFIAMFKHGKAPHINNIQLGKFGRNRTNAWFYDGMNTYSAERDELLAQHATVKPLELMADAILDCSKKDGIVLDPFVGSGTTILAAEQTGRRAFAMELDPVYVDVALRRFIKATDYDPIRLTDGQKFSEIKLELENYQLVEHVS